MLNERGLRVASSDFETTSRNLKIRDTPRLRLAMVGKGPRYVLDFSGSVNPKSLGTHDQYIQSVRVESHILFRAFVTVRSSNIGYPPPVSSPLEIKLLAFAHFDIHHVLEQSACFFHEFWERVRICSSKLCPACTTIS